MTVHPGLGPPPAAAWIGRVLRDALASAPIALHPDWDVLDAEQADTYCGTLRSDEAGLLASRHDGNSAYAIDADTLALFKALRQPVSLNLSEEPPDVIRGLARLICKGVLILDPDRRDRETGGPTSGWAALRDRLPTLADSATTVPPCRNVRLSAEALIHARLWRETLGEDLPDALYDYGRAPTRGPNVEGHRTLIAAADAIDGLKRYGDGAPWLSWRTTGHSAWRRTGGPKLYVSPVDPVEGLCAAFDALGGVPVDGLKIAALASAFARPDACVIYLADAEGLEQAWAALGPALSGIEGRGLPFAAPLDESGLLSWGVDPPFSEEAGPGASPSHRMHLAWRAAAHITSATVTDSCASPVDEAAIEDEIAWRLALDGYVDHGCSPLDGLAHAG